MNTLRLHQEHYSQAGIESKSLQGLFFRNPCPCPSILNRYESNGLLNPLSDDITGDLYVDVISYP